MRLTEEQELTVYDYIMDNLNPLTLCQNGIQRIGNFLLTYKEKQVDDDGTTFEVWINNMIQTADNIGKSVAVSAWLNGVEDDDLILALHEALTDYFTIYDWQSDKWSLDTFGF